MSSALVTGSEREQARARYPDQEGYVERAGQRLFYERYDDGERTVLLLPTWSLIHSRHWKGQIPYLSRHFRVVTFDGVGNGRSDRPLDGRRYGSKEFARDAVAVMDELGVERATVVGLSMGAQFALELAAAEPDRVAGVAVIGPMFPFTPSRYMFMGRRMMSLRLPAYRYWARMNAHHWRADYDEFVEWFLRRCLNDPHSTKQTEDAIGWARETSAEPLIASVSGSMASSREELTALTGRVHCPVLVIHGDRDKITPYRDGKALARLTGGRLHTVRGAGHLPHARRPVEVNLALREFAESCP
jgi:pimeloyl-ACP methyl ester carboxylesterase